MPEVQKEVLHTVPLCDGCPLLGNCPSRDVCYYRVGASSVTADQGERSEHDE